MNRRHLLASAAAFPAAALAGPSPAPAAESSPWAPALIRERIRLVAETFARGTVAFPEPMPAEEAAPLLALSDAEIEEDIEARDAILGFAWRYGVSLDWLLGGDVKALVHACRRGNREHVERAADPLPDMVARWEALERQVSAESREGDWEDHPRAAEHDALEREICAAQADSVAGLAAQMRIAVARLGLVNHKGELRREDADDPMSAAMFSLLDAAQKLAERHGGPLPA